MSWDDIKGHAYQVGFLKNAIASNRVAHAYLFVGPEGVGKRLVALTFAKALNCEGADPPCGNCEPCLTVDKASHPDVRVTVPDEKTGSIKIEQIRDIQERASLKPGRAKVKVEIILGSDGMTQEAQNAFLKVLEEPPGATALILIAENAEALFPTIRSRCHVLKFSPMEFSLVKEILKTRYGVEDKTAHFLASMSGARLGYAISLIDSDIRKRRDEILSDGISALPAGRQENDLELLCGIYRDALVLKSRANSDLLLNADMLEEIKEIADSHTPQELESTLEAIDRSFSYLRQNVSPKLVFLALAERIQRW